MLTLQHLCRQGREAVQVTYELDIMATEYIEHEAAIPAGDVTQDGRILPVDVRTVRKGRLHLRLANVGHPVDNKLAKGGSIPRPVKPKLLVKSGTTSSAFLGGSLNAINSHTKGWWVLCCPSLLYRRRVDLVSLCFTVSCLASISCAVQCFKSITFTVVLWP